MRFKFKCRKRRRVLLVHGGGCSKVLRASATVYLMALRYQTGFGNEHATEALPGALPVGQNSPQKCPLGLYAEQLSGTAFTVPRHLNRRSWLYRIRPSVAHAPFVPSPRAAVCGSFSSALEDGGAAGVLTPNQLRWFPPPMPAAGGGGGSAPVDWVASLFTVAGSGSAESGVGLAIHMYACGAPMVDSAFSNADGEMLIVPQEGGLRLQTEMGLLDVAPREICVVPRGVKFSVEPLGGGAARGYVLEVFGAHFQLPDLGPLGSNGLANARDFEYPVAAFEDRACAFTTHVKFGGHMFTAAQAHSPFDVVAWHGTVSPYKYDLTRFNTIGTVSFDHPDPSIFTVLTVPSGRVPGLATADFVIFPPRWMVAEHTFRPPWYHRNCMSEFMGMVWGAYDAKVGFQPGGASLHSIGAPHGPDAPTFTRASAAELAPDKFDKGLAFMFETCHFLRVTHRAMDAEWRDKNYQKCWEGWVFLPCFSCGAPLLPYPLRPPSPTHTTILPRLPKLFGSDGGGAGEESKTS